MSFSRSGFGRLRMESRTARRGARTSESRRLVLEPLEARLVMSTSTWTGLGTDANWSTAANWDVPPVSGGGDEPGLPLGRNATDECRRSRCGATFGALSFTGGGYSISAASGSTASFTSIDSAQTSGSNLVDVPLALSQATIVTVDNSGETLVLGGVISGTDGIATAGSGTVDLTADNTYTGETSVTAGTLLVDGTQTASAVTVGSGTTLGGMGTVASVLSTGGTVTPGDPTTPGTPTGILTDAGGLSLEAGSTSNNSTFTVVLDGSTPGNGTGHYSQLVAAGPIALSGATFERDAAARLRSDGWLAVHNPRQYGGLDDHRHLHRANRGVDRTDLRNAVPDQLCRRHGQQQQLGRLDRARCKPDGGDAQSRFPGLRPVGRADGNRHRSHGIAHTDRLRSVFQRINFPGNRAARNKWHALL